MNGIEATTTPLAAATIAATQQTPPPALLILYSPNQEQIISVVADVVGQGWTLASGLREADQTPSGVVVGVLRDRVVGGREEVEGWKKEKEERREKGEGERDGRGRRLVVNMVCVDSGVRPEEGFSEVCDYEVSFFFSSFFFLFFVLVLWCFAFVLSF